MTNYAKTNDGTFPATEASMLGWRPGRIPLRFDYLSTTWTLERTERCYGDDVAYHYSASGGRRLVVFND